MGYVVIYRDNQGRVTYLNKLFDSENEAFEFVKSHSINDFEIIDESEFQQYLAEQQQAQQKTGYQQQGGYQQRVTIYSDEREPELQPRRDYGQTYKPSFFRPAFVGRKRGR